MNRNNTVHVIATESSTNQVDPSENENENQGAIHVADFPVSSVIESGKNSKSEQLSEKSQNDKGFKAKMRSILCCRICSELKRCPMYQCKYGHLICAGCLSDILSESKLHNESASCPECHTTITKEFCFRNVAVEKTISELPVACPYCSKECSPVTFRNHEIVSCVKKPAVCSNSIIGCSWQGIKEERIDHECNCPQLETNGYEILKSLEVLDQQCTAEYDLYCKIMELLSVQKMEHTDLQLKMVKAETNNVIFETSKFSSLNNQWIIRAWCHDDVNKSTCLTYQLVIKSKLISPVNLHYILLKGPYSEMEIRPNVYQFKFSDKSDESPFHSLEVPNALDQKIFYTAKRINVRIFMFL